MSDPMQTTPDYVWYQDAQMLGMADAAYGHRDTADEGYRPRDDDSRMTIFVSTLIGLFGIGVAVLIIVVAVLTH